MKIMLTNSPAFMSGYKWHFSYGRFGCTDPVTYEIAGKGKGMKFHYCAYPWALGYASAILKRDSSAQVCARDAQARDYNEKDLSEDVREFKPDILVAELPTISFDYCITWLRQIKAECGFTLILTGLHPAGLAIEIMREHPFVDYIIKGDYGLPLLKLINMELKNPEQVPMLYYRKSGDIVFSSAPLEFVPFDSLPYPDRDDLPVEHYHDFEVAGQPAIHMVSSRGCSHRCAFCNVNLMWPEGFHWKRSPKQVADEMVYCQKKYGARQIYFDDDIMTADRARMVELAQEIIRRKINLPWTFMGDVNIDEELLCLLIKAGAVGVKFGVESINPEVLKGIKKAWVTKEKVKKFVQMCHRHGLWTHATIIIGLPHDTPESIKETIKFVVSLKCFSVQIYSAQPLPGTPFYEEAKKNNWIVARKWEEYDGNYLSPVNYPWFSKADIEKILIDFKRRWEYTAMWLFLTRPWRLRIYLRGKGLKYAAAKGMAMVKNLFTKQSVFMPKS